jgi:uncharacterized membrane protein
LRKQFPFVRLEAEYRRLVFREQLEAPEFALEAQKSCPEAPNPARQAESALEAPKLRPACRNCARLATEELRVKRDTSELRLRAPALSGTFRCLSGRKKCPQIRALGRSRMSPAEVLILAFLIGVIAGLRSLTAPAVVAYAAHQHWLRLEGTPLAFMGSTAALIIFVLLALVELVTDQLPSTPPRTKGPGLIARIVLGGLSGTCVAVAGASGALFGALLGIAGAPAGTFGGYQARTGLVKALKVRDFVIATLEDLVAIAGGLFIVSRF